jgi:hypothetical protein
MTVRAPAAGGGSQATEAGWVKITHRMGKIHPRRHGLRSGTLFCGGRLPLGDTGQPVWGVWLSALEQGAPPGEAIENALRWLLKATAAQVAILFLPDPSGEQVEFAYVAGERADELRGFRLRPSDSLIAPAF